MHIPGEEVLAEKQKEEIREKGFPWQGLRRVWVQPPGDRFIREVGICKIK